MRNPFAVGSGRLEGAIEHVRSSKTVRFAGDSKMRKSIIGPFGGGGFGGFGGSMEFIAFVSLLAKLLDEAKRR